MLLMGEKQFQEVTLGGRCFFGNSERVRGITLSSGNGKSEGVWGLDIFWKHKLHIYLFKFIYY